MRALLILWQLPQWLLGWTVVGVLKARGKIVNIIPCKRWYRTWNANVLYLTTVCETSLNLGGSFGPLVIVPENRDENTLMHERGHSVQSMMLGPLYLFVVGIPSFTMNVLSVVLWMMGREQFARDYYKRWPESWADRIAGIER